MYLDNASTSWPKPPAVAAAMQRYLEDNGASPGRAGHRAAVEAERLVNDTRRKLTELFGGDNPDRMIFCPNCTDALNMALKGALAEGDHVVTTVLEHNSVSRPLQAMTDAGWITQTRVACNGEGVIDPDDVACAITPKTRLIACTHASNVLGTMQPIEAVGRLAREHELLLLLDAAQTAGVVDISVRRMNVDLLAFPGHKSLLGPSGTGGLYVGSRAELRPWREGGTGGDSASPTQPSELPHRLEAGTPNTLGIVGLGAALEVLEPAANLAHERAMLTRLIEGISANPRIRILGSASAEHRVGTLSLVIDDLAPEEAAAVLDEAFGIAVRGGLQCAPQTHQALDTYPEGTLRISPGWQTTTEQIDRTVDALGQLAT
ncbi:MAG: aminotransferase class V-fold PLP-dependent enzyme [bacterium]|nr:aminotransferase class V-fold PLP-dependent enzyme [bacterium]